MGAPISRKSIIGVPLQIVVYYSKFVTHIKILIEFDSAKYTFDFINGRISEIRGKFVIFWNLFSTVRTCCIVNPMSSY